MSVPLVVLSILCFYLFYTFPSVNPTTSEGGWFAQLIQKPGSVTHVVTDSGPMLASAEGGAAGHGTGHHDSSHLIAMVLSLLIAGTGIVLSYLTYYRRRISADAWAARLPGLHRFLKNKWYFDELYEATIIQGLLVWNRILHWFDATIIDGLVNGSAAATRQVSDVSGVFDLTVIDGAVNGVADVTRFGGRLFRRVQTGRIQHYLAGAMICLLIAILIRWL
jgi:NADH-quinone oxidoreductase subunit L